MEEIFASFNEIKPRLHRLKKQLMVARIFLLCVALLNVSGFARYLFVDGYFETIGGVHTLWLALTPLIRLFLIWWSLRYPFRGFLALAISWGYYIMKTILSIIVSWYDQSCGMMVRGNWLALADFAYFLLIVFICCKAWKYEQLKRNFYA